MLRLLFVFFYFLLFIWPQIILLLMFHQYIRKDPQCYNLQGFNPAFSNISNVAMTALKCAYVHLCTVNNINISDTKNNNKKSIWTHIKPHQDFFILCHFHTTSPVVQYHFNSDTFVVWPPKPGQSHDQRPNVFRPVSSVKTKIRPVEVPHWIMTHFN